VTRTEWTSVRIERMPPKLVDFVRVGRACDPYRRYICKSNKDAALASWLDSYRKYICKDNKDAASASCLDQTAASEKCCRGSRPGIALGQITCFRLRPTARRKGCDSSRRYICTSNEDASAASDSY
jgi:hypothetical protein